MRGYEVRVTAEDGADSPSTPCSAPLARPIVWGRYLPPFERGFLRSRTFFPDTYPCG